MFTGLVTLGTLAGRFDSGIESRLAIQAPFAGIELGESIAVMGACLTVASLQSPTFMVDVSSETLAKTTLGKLREGSVVNVERAMTFGSRLGGHLVTGHVDGAAHVLTAVSVGDSLKMTFEVTRDLARLIATKGSIALDGVSLTVNVVEGATFDVMLVPHTLQSTTLAQLLPGDAVNVEVDILARYVARSLACAHEDRTS